MHFALEEGYGYFEEAIAVAPELSSRAATLRAQHESLYTDMNQLVEDARLSKGVGTLAQIVSRTRALVDGLREHERGEQELILRAYDDDLGVGD